MIRLHGDRAPITGNCLLLQANGLLVVRHGAHGACFFRRHADRLLVRGNGFFVCAGHAYRSGKSHVRFRIVGGQPQDLSSTADRIVELVHLALHIGKIEPRARMLGRDFHNLAEEHLRIAKAFVVDGDAGEQPGCFDMMRFPGEDLAIDHFRRLQVAVVFKIYCFAELVRKAFTLYRCGGLPGRSRAHFELPCAFELLVNQVVTGVEPDGDLVRCAGVRRLPPNQQEVSLDFKRRREVGRHANGFVNVRPGLIKLFQCDAGLTRQAQQTGIVWRAGKKLLTKSQGFREIA